MKKDLITIKDLTVSEIKELFDLAAKFKVNRKTHEALLKNKTLGLIFEKPSNRTRVCLLPVPRMLGRICRPVSVPITRPVASSRASETVSAFISRISFSLTTSTAPGASAISFSVMVAVTTMDDGD